LCIVLGIVTIIFGVNEATLDALDMIGSNYWLAYASTASGIIIIAMIALSFKKSS